MIVRCFDRCNKFGDPNKFLTRNYGPNYMKEFKSSSWDHKKAKRINDVVAIDSDELSNSKDLK